MGRFGAVRRYVGMPLVGIRGMGADGYFFAAFFLFPVVDAVVAFLRTVVEVFLAELVARRVVVVFAVVAPVVEVFLAEIAVRRAVVVFAVAAPFAAAFVDVLPGEALLRVTRVVRRVVVPFCCGFSSPAAVRCGRITSW